MASAKQSNHFEFGVVFDTWRYNHPDFGHGNFDFRNEFYFRNNAMAELENFIVLKLLLFIQYYYNNKNRVMFLFGLVFRFPIF